MSRPITASFVATVLLSAGVAGCFSQSPAGGVGARASCPSLEELLDGEDAGASVLVRSLVHGTTCVPSGGEWHARNMTLASTDGQDAFEWLVAFLRSRSLAPVVMVTDDSSWLPSQDSREVLWPGLRAEDIRGKVVHSAITRIGNQERPAELLLFSTLEAPENSTWRLSEATTLNTGTGAALSASSAAAMLSAALAWGQRAPESQAVDVAFSTGDLGGYRGFGPLGYYEILDQQMALHADDRYKAIIQIQGAGLCEFQPVSRRMLEREPASAELYDFFLRGEAARAQGWNLSPGRYRAAIEPNQTLDFRQRPGQVFAAELWLSYGLPAIALDPGWWSAEVDGKDVTEEKWWPLGTEDDTISNVCWDSVAAVEAFLEEILDSVGSIPTTEVSECGRHYPRKCSR